MTLAGGACLLALGCAPSAPPASAAPPPAASASASNAPPTAAPGRPNDLGGWVIVARPARDLPVLAHFVPPSNPFATIFGTPQVAVENVLGQPLANEIDLERPFVLGTSGEKMFAALGIRSEAGFRSRLSRDFELKDSKNGAVRVLPRQKTEGALACSLFPGRDVKRLVCAADEKLVAEMGPFLARADEDLPASVAMRAVLPHQRIGASGIVRDDPPLSEAYRLGRNAAASFARDIEESTLDVTLGAGKLELALEHTFRGASSPLTLAWLGGQEQSEAPDAFWRLPEDTDLALFLPARDGVKLRGAWKPYLTGILAGDEKRGGPGHDLSEAIERAALSGAPSLVAMGWDRVRGARELKSNSKSSAAESALSGWTLIHVARPHETWLGDIESILKASVAQDAAEVRAGIPKARIGAYRSQPLRTAERLPAGSGHFVYSFKTNRAKKDKSVPEKPPYDVFLYLAPSATGSWLVLSRDEEVALSHLRQVLAERRAEVPELGSLRGRRGLLVGFASVGGIASAMVDTSTEENAARALQQLGGIQLLPNRGQTRIPFVVETLPPVGSGLRRTRLTMTVLAPAITDIGRLLTQGQAEP